VNPLFEAAWEMHQFLTAVGFPYAIIGGLALQHWGEPRFTANVDITVAVPADATDEFLQQATSRFTPRITDAVRFARDNRVLLVTASNGCPVDICLAAPGYEDHVMQRAVLCELQRGMETRVCSAEDLVVHKLVAGRPRDLEDARSVIARQRDRLDTGYVRRWLAEFAAASDQPDLPELFEAAWRAVQET
jgi:hypothetical protein